MILMDAIRTSGAGDFDCFSFYDPDSWESVRKSIIDGARVVVEDSRRIDSVDNQNTKSEKKIIRRVFVYGNGSNGRVKEVVGLLRGVEGLDGVEIIVGKPEEFVSGRDYLINVDGVMKGR
jgi:hypothetical protein